MQGEVTTNTINQAKNIIRKKIPHKVKDTKVLRYDDESNSFFREKNSIETVLSFFQKPQKATEAAVNLEKTTILSSNNDQITN